MAYLHFPVQQTFGIQVSFEPFVLAYLGFVVEKFQRMNLRRK